MPIFDAFSALSAFSNPVLLVCNSIGIQNIFEGIVDGLIVWNRFGKAVIRNGVNSIQRHQRRYDESDVSFGLKS